jgi:hypothetical protein
MNEQIRLQPKSILDLIENQLALARKLQTVYDNRPDPKDFEGAMSDTKFADDYTKEAIEKDEKYVETTNAKIEEKNSSFGREELDRREIGFAHGEMLQAMVVDQLNKGWLKEFKAVMTSAFDDLNVGADAVLKHKTGQYLAASFDFTICDKKIYHKLEKVWERNIEKGSIPNIKYYEDPDTHEKGKIIAPKFIIGASYEDMEEMAKSYLDGTEDKLKNHKFQYMIIEQMYEQLVNYMNYFDHHRDDARLDFANKEYKKVYLTIQRIRDNFQREGKINNVEFLEYCKKSKALAEIRSFNKIKEAA